MPLLVRLSCSEAIGNRLCQAVTHRQTCGEQAVDKAGLALPIPPNPSHGL